MDTDSHIPEDSDNDDPEDLHDDDAKIIAKLRAENKHQFDVLHELRARMSRMNFLGGEPLTVSARELRCLYELVNSGMNPPPKSSSKIEQDRCPAVIDRFQAGEANWV